MDFSKLICKRKYIVPVRKPKFKSLLSQALKSVYPVIDNLHAYTIREVKRSSYTFRRSIRYSYLHMGLMGRRVDDPELIRLAKELTQEYKKGLPETAKDTLKHLRDDVPYEIHVRVTGAEQDQCICEVECVPLLYEKLSLGIKKPEKVDEFKIQDACHSCESFLKDIFEAELSAIPIEEEKKDVLKPILEFLVNDEITRQIHGRIINMIENATGEILLIGWIGTPLIPKLTEIMKKGVRIQVITHKPNQAKGQPWAQEVQKGYKKIIDLIGLDNISTKPEVHGRAVIVDNKAIVGSMDLNSYSLTGAHKEFAIYTEDPKIVRNLRNYYNAIFSPLSKEKAK